MKDEIVTCDRCGRKIEKPVLPWMTARRYVTLEHTDYEAFVFALKNKEDAFKEAMKFGAVRLELRGDMYGKTKRYDLCRKCEKAFQMFIQGPISD